MPTEWFPGTYQQPNVKLFLLETVISVFKNLRVISRYFKKYHTILKNNNILVEHINTIGCF